MVCCRAMTSGMTPEQIRRWAENMRQAEERIREEIRSGGYGGDPIAAAFGLAVFAAQLHGWPIRRDPVSEREDEAVRETWARLREAYGKP